MANNITGFYETLITGIGEYNEAVQGQISLVKNVYNDVKSDVARIGNTLQIPFPDVGNFTDQAANDWTTTDIDTSNFVTMTFSKRPGKGLLIRSFEQYKTAQDIVTAFITPMRKRMGEYLNGQIATLITTSNFAANAPIIGTQSGSIALSDATSAWANLAAAKVPLDSPEDLKLFIHQDVQAKMMGDAQFANANIVSEMAAIRARQSAMLSQTFGFMPYWDQQMPTASATTIQGTVDLTNGTTAVVGHATSFTQELTTSNKVVFGSDTTRTAYTISAINSDTSITLSANYSGSTVAGTTVKKQTSLAGTVTNSASATVTGSGTAFTTALTVGDWLVFGNDTTKTPYQVAAIASDTSLTLTGPYAGTTGSGTTASVRNYTCLAMNKYAIGLALRNLPSPDADGIPNALEWSYQVIDGIPCRVMLSYQHLKDAWLLTFDFGYALAVMRPTFGNIIKV